MLIENESLLRSYDTAIDNIRRGNLFYLYFTCRESQKKLEDISNLMIDFSMKVLEQAENIDSLYTINDQSKLNMSNANSELQEANKSGVNFRIIALILMILSGLTMLFIDWYQ